MKVIDRYFLKEFIKIIAIIELLSVGIYLLIDTISRFEKFQGTGNTIGLAFNYFLLKIPLMIFQTIPLSCLLATLFVGGTLAKHFEIAAFKTSGVSSKRMIVPFLVSSFLISLFLFALSELIIPWTYSNMGLLKQEIKVKKGKTLFYEGIIFKPTQNSFCLVKLFDPVKKNIYNASLFELNESFDPIKRLDAPLVHFEKNRWIAKDMEISLFDSSGHISKTKFYKMGVFPIPLKPKHLTVQDKEPEEMNFLELKRFIQQQKAAGRNPKGLEVDNHLRFAFPLVCPIMVLLGFPIATRSFRPSLAKTIALSLPLGFGYWVVMSFARYLGQGEILTPFVAAWIGNLIFLCFGCLLLKITK